MCTAACSPSAAATSTVAPSVQVLATYRGTWARVTIDHFRHLAFQNCLATDRRRQRRGVAGEGDRIPRLVQRRQLCLQHALPCPWRAVRSGGRLHLIQLLPHGGLQPVQGRDGADRGDGRSLRLVVLLAMG
jgi:hypothetical protein